MLSEISQLEKNKYHTISLIHEVSQKDKDHYSILTHIYGI